jgi:SAM-dependent methyltransferase
MIKTAESNGILWRRGYDWIRNEFSSQVDTDLDLGNVPVYYQKPFHAYEKGNLSWDAAFESELASCAVGARNVPLQGKHGEMTFRSMFELALQQAGATVPPKGIIVDLGCSTGVSTRRLAQKWPTASEIIGIDLSPYFIEVGKKLLQLQPKSTDEGGPWVSSIQGDDRISLRLGNIERNTGLFNVDMVQLQFVAHELPPAIARQVVDEAFRMLKPGGQFWMCEMDFQAPAYAAQRSNPLLFCLIRATEPYLDEYADSAADLRRYIADKFMNTKVVAATGRHYALVATKGEDDNDATGFLEDLRFNPDGTYRKEDTHLKVWENKQNNN